MNIIAETAISITCLTLGLESVVLNFAAPSERVKNHTNEARMVPMANEIRSSPWNWPPIDPKITTVSK